MKGKFVVFEGLDGAGAETQSKLLYNYLKKKNKKVEMIGYPDYKGPIGNLIHQYLHKKYTFSNETLTFLFVADFLKDKEKINKWLKEGKIVISNRYMYSTLAYEGRDKANLKYVIDLLKLTKLPRPDLIFYLDISPKTSKERKYKEKKNLDRNEENTKLLTEVSKRYNDLAKKNVLGKWVVIDGEKSKEEIHEQIISIIKKILR